MKPENDKKNHNTARNSLLIRTSLVYVCVVIVGLVVIGRIIDWQFISNDRIIEQANSLIDTCSIPVQRGTVMSRNQEPLIKRWSTYGIYMDTNPYEIVTKNNVSKKEYALTDSIFKKNISALADSLSNVFGSTLQSWEQKLRDARVKNHRYFKINDKATFAQVERVKTFPIFCTVNPIKKTRRVNKNILIIESVQEIVQYSYGEAARRTIGAVTEYDVKEKDSLTGKDIMRVKRDLVGLEGYYDKELTGTPGIILKRRMLDVAMEIEDDYNVIPCNGYNIITTLDMNIQDLAHKSLKNTLTEHNADEGCVIVMEVATGDILAISNISKDQKGEYREIKNVALTNYEPGSIFKTASLLVALDEKKITLNTKIPINYKSGATASVGHRNVTDDHVLKRDPAEVWYLFAQSSNIGTTRAIYDHYSSNQKAFIDGLYRFGFKDTLDFPIIGGSQIPTLRTPDHPRWSKTTISTIPMGYEVEVTPLHMLMFYNAIANNGCMVKPRLVSKINSNNEIIKSFEIDTLNPNICSESALQQIHAMLDSVMTCGTGTGKFTGAPYTVAGKTGTSRIYSPDAKGERLYNASFCGYFPADNPKYSCIVVIKKPRNNKIYGGSVALPVFRDIADKLYATDYDLMPEIQENKLLIKNKKVPFIAKGQAKIFETIFNLLKIDIPIQAGSEWVVLKSNEKGNLCEAVKLKLDNKTIPDVKNMTLKDAVYVMEQSGIVVEISGYGRVKRQFPEPNAPIRKGQKVTLELDI